MASPPPILLPLFRNWRFSILYVPPFEIPSAPLHMLWRPTIVLFFNPSLSLTSLGKAVLGDFLLGIWTSRSTNIIYNVSGIGVRWYLYLQLRWYKCTILGVNILTYLNPIYTWGHFWKIRKHQSFKFLKLFYQSESSMSYSRAKRVTITGTLVWTLNQRRTILVQCVIYFKSNLKLNQDFQNTLDSFFFLSDWNIKIHSHL